MILNSALFGQIETISHRFGRLGSFTEWWQWLSLFVVCMLVAVYTVWMYRRDSIDLSRPLAVVLTILRLTAFCGILFYYFKLERRFERQLVKNSRALVLVDTSQSNFVEFDRVALRYDYKFEFAASFYSRAVEAAVRRWRIHEVPD